MKRGSILDALMGGFYLFGLVFVMFILYYVFSQLNAGVYSGFVAAGANSNVTNMINATQNATTNFIGTIPLITAGVGISAIAAAYLTPMPAFFLPIGLLLLAVAVVISIPFQEAIQTILQTSVFAAIANTFTLPSQIVMNLTLFVGAVGVMILIAGYAKQRTDSGGQPGV